MLGVGTRVIPGDGTVPGVGARFETGEADAEMGGVGDEVVLFN